MSTRNKRSNALPEFRPERGRSLQGQITEALREWIRTGTLQAGDRLPSTQELAGRWETTDPTIQRAMAPLVAEGLLERTPRVGTFVRRRPARLERVGIYLPSSLTDELGDGFTQRLCDLIREELATAGIAATAWMDIRPEAERIRPLPELVRAVSGNRIQALIVARTNPRCTDWLCKLPVPTMFCTGGRLPNRVGTDLVQLVDAGIEALTARGCRRVGLIASVQNPLVAAPVDRRPPDTLLDHWWEAVAAAAVECRPEWVRRPELTRGIGGAGFERFGRESFAAIWAEAERPDGLMVVSDVTARGVLMSLFEHHVRVPDQLELVLQRNVENGLYCPVPATFLDLSVGEVAQALVAQARRLFAGEAVTPVHVPYHLVPSPTAVTASGGTA